MDCLSDVLNRTRFKGSVYSLCEFTAPWGLQMPGFEGHVSFFMVMRGGCIVTLNGSNETISLAGGELLLLPRSSAWTIQDSTHSATTPIEELFKTKPPRGQTVKLGGGGALTSVLMGCFEFDTRVKNPLMDSLPNTIHLRSEHLQSEPWLETTLRLLAFESGQTGPGSDLLVSRLTDMIFVQVIRAFLSRVKNCSEAPSWLRALADPEIGAALNLIHEKPEQPWTVATLATAVGMSRTSFATRFTTLVTSTPMDYLTSWRMQQAVSLMERGDTNMVRIARAVGYTSEAAFAKAFKREIGEAPGGFRRKLSSEQAIAR